MADVVFIMALLYYQLATDIYTNHIVINLIKLMVYTQAT